MGSGTEHSMFSFNHKEESYPFLSAVIVAAGVGSRMAGIDKQKAVIDDTPVVARSIARFEECRMVSEIILVCREEQIADYYSLVQDYAFAKVSSVVKGGGHRQHSVFNGIEACSKDALFYAIHDGARPLVSIWEIEQCFITAIEFGASAVGTPVKDTIKICDERGFIVSTPDRNSLRAIRTPQIFAAKLYREAMKAAKRSGRLYTDDCQLVENTGHPVFVSHGSFENIKITTPEDIAIAQAILSFREEAGEQ